MNLAAFSALWAGLEGAYPGWARGSSPRLSAASELRVRGKCSTVAVHVNSKLKLKIVAHSIPLVRRDSILAKTCSGVVRIS